MTPASSKRFCYCLRAGSNDVATARVTGLLTSWQQVQIIGNYPAASPAPTEISKKQNQKQIKSLHFLLGS
jgi:hypothetical protein